MSDQPQVSRLQSLLNLRSSRVALAVGIALLMLGSSLFLGVSAAASPLSVGPGVPARATSLYVGLESGAQLQKAALYSVPGSALDAHPGAVVQSPVAANTPMSFTVGFQMRNTEQLSEIIQAQSTPSSPLYHQWLTLDQERAMFGPDPVAYQNTINYFTSLGFKVQTEGLLSVSFSGSAGQVNSAFHTQLSNVALGTPGATAPMNSQPLSLPAPIAGAIATVNGLDGSQVAHPTSSINPWVAQDMAGGNAQVLTAPTPATVGPSATGVPGNLSTIFNNSNRGFFWIYYYSHSHRAYRTFQVITPGALSLLYNATELINQGINGDSTGTPINIAIVMAGGINPTDLFGYGNLTWANYKQITNRLSPTPVDGAFTDNGTVTWTDGASSEMALDIEFSSTMAPGAHITPVYGPTLSTNVLDDDYATLEAMAKVPNIISNSWGGDEDHWPNMFGPNWANGYTMHYYFQLLTGRGATILASSGDGGGFDTSTGFLSGSFPATDPYVLSVNGLETKATDTSGSVFPTQTTYGIVNISIGSEPQTPFFYGYPVHASKASRLYAQDYWYEPISNYTLTGAPPSGSGGFDSSYFFNQTWMEHGYGIPDLGRSLGSGVAAEADFNQSIYFDGDMQFFWGGTSFACPTTAGELALIEDYLAHNGHNPLLGNGNGFVYDVANAFANGNLSLKPFYDVVSKPGVSANGTSYWGNYGVLKGYEFPTAQKFPYAAQGWTTYGNTTPGWDFPTGFGSIIVNNFAIDLNTLENMPGTFGITNSAQTAWDPGAWDYMSLNHTYTVHVNASSPLILTTPHVTVVFHGADGTNTSFQPVTTSTAIPTTGLSFQLDTGAAPFSQPGFAVFELGNSTNPSLGFAYDWISYPPPASGTLNVTVLAPSGGTILSGYPEFNPWPFGYAAPTFLDPNCCTAVPNTFTVHVTLNGQPVYNARVDASVANLNVLAWAGSLAQSATNSQGHAHFQSPTILSESYTNQQGDAIVDTWNLVQPTTYFVNATLGGATGGTTITASPGPNVRTFDNYGGTFSNFNTVKFILQDLHQPTDTTHQNQWVPNSVDQSGMYNMMYAWQGEILKIGTNDYTGATMPGVRVWLGNLDFGGENRYYGYEPTFGVVGVTNVSGTANITGSDGSTTIFIPDNQSDNNYFTYPTGATAGFAYVAASMPGQFNRTFSYTEPCAPTLPDTKATLITCQYNDTFQRNYTATPTLVLADPINETTETTSHVARDFFGSGANISVHANVLLPSNDPFVTGYGYNWLPGVEHVVNVTAYVDGKFAADLSPGNGPDWQNYTVDGNLTGTYSPGIHDLRVVATDSAGHIFTRDHTFVVGSINVTDLSTSANSYTVLPYNLTWSYIIPSTEMNNHTFSQALEIRYVTGGCGGTTRCPQVVNLTIKIRDGVVDYSQSLNSTLLNLNHFYSGAAELPSGQYQIILWLNANHSGSIADQIDTQLVLSSVQAQINGPSNGASVPVGNVTISYAYSGQYIQNATLYVYPDATGAEPVFSAGAFVPGLSGLRGGAATWTAVGPGEYKIVLALGTPYGSYNATSVINVSATSGTVFLNQSHPSNILAGLSPAVTATILAIVAAIVGMILGLFVAPAFRSRPAGPSAAAAGPGGPKESAAPWQEDAKAGGKLRCTVCQEEFETQFALHQHLKISHGIEE
jgi:subtilase family serine protease